MAAIHLNRDHGAYSVMLTGGINDTDHGVVIVKTGESKQCELANGKTSDLWCLIWVVAQC